MSRVPVYNYDRDNRREIIAMVNYSDNLDYYNGKNYGNGNVGRHLGITKLKNGKFVLIHGTDFQGERDYAEVVTNEEALKAILESGKEKMLEFKKFAPLKELLLNLEEEEEE